MITPCESSLTGVLAALHRLREKWLNDGNFLSGPDDSIEDRLIGKTLKECSEELRILIGG